MDLIKLNLGCDGWCDDTKTRHPNTWKRGTVDDDVNVFLKG